MLNSQSGFSLLETLLAMAIGSVLLLACARFLPALQLGVMQHSRMQIAGDEVWQQVWTVAKHLQRAGYCNGQCTGQPLTIDNSGACVIVQWDSNSNGRWEPSGHSESEQMGFRLQNGALETLRGATRCSGRGWEKTTDPGQITVQRFNVSLQRTTGFAPQLTVSMVARVVGLHGQEIAAALSVTGYNL
ncbi:prepilin peptidase-dependent protein [Kosakonia sp.]|uniref:prepilin peptidase-dependent protein n=1 Tax=Kosakonia sp. TaxID=1916651 RepID=UPI0028A2119A|nr:prepilin peptidase-dependent protein [Kosakonia sp.]